MTSATSTNTPQRTGDFFGNNKTPFYSNQYVRVELSVERGCGGFTGRGNKLLPIRASEAVSEELARHYKRPLGLGMCEGVSPRLDRVPKASLPSQRTGVLGGQGTKFDTGSAKAPSEGSNFRAVGDPQLQRSVYLPAICCPEEGRGNEASNKPQTAKQLCQTGILQDGRSPYSERSSPTRRLDDKGRPEGRILCDPSRPILLEVSSLPMAREVLPIPLPAIRPVVCSVGLYQDHEAHRHDASVTRDQDSHIHRRYPDPRKRQADCQRAHRSSDLSFGEPGLHHQLGKVSGRPESRNRILGPHGRLPADGTKASGVEDQGYQTGGKHTAPDDPSDCSRDFETARKDDSRESCDDGGAIILSPSPIMPATGSPAVAGLQPSLSIVDGSARGADLVDCQSPFMERQVHPSTRTGPHYRDGRIGDRLGRQMRRPSDRRTMVHIGNSPAHKLPGTVGGSTGNKVIRQEPNRYFDPPENGQHLSSDLRQQDGRHSLTRTEPNHQGPVVMVPFQEHYLESLALSRHPQHMGRRGISSHEGQIRLDALPEDIPGDQPSPRSTGGRPVRLTPDHSTSTLRELASGPRGGGHRCLYPQLGGLPGIRKSSMEPGCPSSQSDSATRSHSSSDHTSVENSELVPTAPTVTLSRAPPAPPGGRSHPTNPPGQPTSHPTPPSRVAYLRERFSSKELSQQASDLLLASWRHKSGKTYDSLFSKWAGWCTERDIDPISGDISSVINFLADLFHSGYQHRSLCAYRSAISSVHENVEGQPIGSHPMVSRLLKGVFHQRPPQPRYSSTWDVNVVTTHIQTLGDNATMSLSSLTLKLVTLLALTRPSRSVDLANLDKRFSHYSPEGVTFQSAKLAKQSRQNKPIKDFFFPKFSQNEKLCPVLALREYEKRTAQLRTPTDTQLFLAMIRPHKPVSSSTIARWVKTMLTNAGVDTTIFKAHSVRSAATTTAATAGLTMSIILDAADWSTESVFQKFYYKPKSSTTFGHTVLSH